MSLESRGRRGRRSWAGGALGLLVAAYGCGGSSSTDFDQNANPHAGTGATAGRSAAGSAGQSGTSPGANGGTSAATGGRGGSGNAGTSAHATGGARAAGGANAAGTANSAGGPGGGSPAAAGEGGAASGAGGEGGALACEPNDRSAPFEARCLACASDTCGECLCTSCTQKLQTCEGTPGCEDIASCVIASGCSSVACYCGTHELVECLGGQSDGPCKDAILNAPGGHAPTASDISAGPAADAALAVGLCATSGGVCAASCM